MTESSQSTEFKLFQNCVAPSHCFIVRMLSLSFVMVAAVICLQLTYAWRGSGHSIATIGRIKKHTILPTHCATNLASSDPDVWSIINAEHNRQFRGIELIASENIVSSAVMEALGSCMTNKYSEGLPNSRYYGGNINIDQMELLCQARALSLFNLNTEDWGVNVQPYSGSPANFAVYTALLKPHDRIMGLDLPSGGHLTHGYQTNKRKVSATSIFFESMPYKVHPVTGLVDNDELATLAALFKPKLLIAGASAYPRDWDYARMREIADSVGAYLMADIAHVAGIVAAKQCNSPFPYCDVVTSTTHKSLRGPRSGLIFFRKPLADAINNAVFPALQGGPHNHQIGKCTFSILSPSTVLVIYYVHYIYPQTAAVAVALKEAADPSFTHYIQCVKASAAALASHLQNHGYTIVTGGTDNHIVLWDARSTGLSGAKLEKLLEACEISVNKNSIVGDTSAVSPGGVRLGTLAMTTRGMSLQDMKHIADLIHRVVGIGRRVEASYHQHTGTQEPPTEPVQKKKLAAFLEVMHCSPFAEELAAIRNEVHAYASQFPLPGLQP